MGGEGIRRVGVGAGTERGAAEQADDVSASAEYKGQPRQQPRGRAGAAADACCRK